MGREYLDFDVAISSDGPAYTSHVVASPAGVASAPFTLPFAAPDLAQFMIAVGPPRVSSRRLVPAAARVVDVKEYGRRLGDALLAGPVGESFRASLKAANQQGNDLRLRLRLEAVPELDAVPWEYLYDTALDRFLTLSRETPIVRMLDSVEHAPAVPVALPLKVLVMISSPSDMPALAVDRERKLLVGTTGDLVKSGQLELVVIEGAATLGALQKALIDDFNVFHFIGHGGFDPQAQEGVLVLQKEDGTSDRVSGARLGTLLHDARAMQLAVLNACEGARTSGFDAFSGVAQSLVRQGLPAVVAMQTEISDRAALVFSHELYWFLTRGLGVDAAICEVRKAMATSDEASEWGTAVLLRSGTDQPFTFPTGAADRSPSRENRWESLYDAAQGAIAARAPKTALPMLEQLAVENPDYQDVTALIEQVRPDADSADAAAATFEEAARAAASDVTATQPLRVEAPTTEPVPLDPESSGPAPTPSPPAPPVETIRAGSTTGGNARPPRNRMLQGVLAVVVVGALAATGFVVVPKLLGGGGRSVDQACGPAPASGAPGGTQTTFAFTCATTAPVIDGDFGDWGGVPSIPVSAQVYPAAATASSGFSAQWQGQWDTDALYLHATVVDSDLRSVNDARPSEAFKGDGISFELGPDPRSLAASDGTRRGEDHHVMVGLSNSSASGTLAAINPASRGTFTTGKAQPSITAARHEMSSGYELEVRVPWNLINANKPERGGVFGINLNVSDATSAPAAYTLQRMISSNPVRSGDEQSHPRRWQTLVLADTAS